MIAIGKFKTCMLVMKNPKLNLRKLLRFSPAGIEKKYMIGNKMKFHIVQTTHALVMATRRIEEPIIANNLPKARNSCVVAAHAANSIPARLESSNQDQPVKEIGKAPMLPSVILACATTIMPQRKIDRSAAAVFGILPKK
mmetsp:Transcript_2097/g.3036  ORF Transcript_2097/g.3036 Transcript_2097/m.3036 type:complete len:140 (+) Transcript_2097:405-824(+)